MDTIGAIALRRFTRNGARFKKDASLLLTQGEFDELQAVGLVALAPMPKAPLSKAKAASPPDTAPAPEAD